VTGPVWDGKGVDPWLPARLNARLDAARVERDVREAVWAALSAWLVWTARRVLRDDQPPDPDAIWARAPVWRDAVDLLLQGEILTAIGLAYTRLLGSDYPWDQRVFVVRYLAEVRNRLVRVPEEVYALVAGQLATGINLGESIPALSSRVDTVLSITGQARWQNRATVIARTETIGALNAGRSDAFTAVTEQTGDPLEKFWLSTSDARTRTTHRLAEGQRVPVGQPFVVGGAELQFPGDPTGPPQEVIQCVPGETLVNFPGLRSAIRRRYKGEMVRIELTTGDQLTITPNHPVLRADGLWTPAGEVQEGDQLVHTIAGRQLPGQPDPGHMPAKISKVYSSARLVSMSYRVALTPPDLHRDSPEGDVQVVPVNRDLAFHGEPATDEEVRQFGFTFADQARTGLSRAEHPLDPASLVSRGLESTLDPAGLVSGSGKRSAGFRIEPGHADPVGFAAGSNLQVQSFQPAEDGGTADLQRAGHAEHALPPFVTLAEVVKINRYAFSGHVFNLDTGHGWYSANSIIVRNCRCTMLLVEPGESVDLSGRQMKVRR